MQGLGDLVGVAAGARPGGGRRGPWQLVHLLGGGEDTEVWLAERDGRPAALKVLRSGDDRSTRLARVRLAREVAALDRVGNDGVVRLDDVGDDEEAWLAFRYEAAGTLADRLRRGPLPPAELAATLAPVARVLDRAHALGVVHRDVTPANLLLTDGGPLVADWASASASGTSFDGWLHGVRAVVGTEGFVAPEARSGATPPAPALDVWALGAVLRSALDGDGPLTAAGRDLEALIDACLQRDPDDRPAMGRVAERLAALGAGWAPAFEPAPSPEAGPGTGDEARPEARPEPAPPVAVLGPEPPPRSGAAPRRGARRHSLDEVRSHRADAVARGELGSLLVVAPPGAGKTWLLSAAAQEALADGWTVVRAACDPLSAGLRVLGPWVAGLERRSGGARGRPSDRDARLEVVAGGAVPGDVGPLAVADALAALVEAAAPVLCLLDDVHLADRELVEVLEALAYRSGVPGLLLLAGRPQGVDADDLGATAVPLEPLDDDAVRDLVAVELGRPPTAFELAAVVGAADGNPLHAREAATSIARGEDVADRSLAELVARRLSALPASGHASRDLAAVCGPAFWPEALGAEVVDATVVLLERGLVVPRLRSRVPGSVEVRFAHPVFQEVARGVVPHERSIELHARVARALDGAGAPAGLVVAHAVAAVDGGVIDLRDDAVRVATAAARDSLDHLALDAAEEQLATARRLAIGSPAAEVGVLGAELAVRRGRPAEALSALEPVLDAPGPLGSSARQIGVEAALATGRLERAQQLAERSLAELDPASAAWGRCAVVAATVLLRRGAAVRALELADRAESLLAGLDDRIGRASAAVTAAMASSEVEWGARGLTSETSRRAVRASALSRAVDRRRWVQTAPALVDSLYPTDWPAARRIAEEAADEADALGDAVALPALAYFCADFAVEAGDRAAADRWLEALGPDDTDGVWSAPAAALRTVVAAAAAPGRAERWAPDLVELAARLRRAGDEQWSTVAATAVALHLWEGRPSAAAALADRIGLDRGAPDLTALGTMLALRGGPPPPPLHPSEPDPATPETAVAPDVDLRRVDDLALLAALSGDRGRADALLRHRAGLARAGGVVRTLRMVATYPGYLTWALGPEDTDPPVGELLRWLRHDGFPGIWVVHRVLVGLVLAERGTPGIEVDGLRRLLGSVPAEPALAGWIGDRLDRLDRLHLS